MQQACAKGDAVAVEACLQAAQDGSLEHMLLDAGNNTGLTPLGWAALQGNADVVKLLLAHMPERQVLQPGTLSCIPLMLVASKGNMAMCQVLLEFVPEEQLRRFSSHLPDANCSDATALMSAANNGHAHVLKVLLDRLPELAPELVLQQKEQ